MSAGPLPLIIGATRMVFGFAVGGYDRRQPLVIDPVVAYSFSFGGSGDEQVYDIAADETGAVYVGGETYSTDFPTVNPAQPRDNAGNICNSYGSGNSICRDAFLAKLSSDGKSLEYATYFGSRHFDQVNHIAVDSSHALLLHRLDHNPNDFSPARRSQLIHRQTRARWFALHLHLLQSPLLPQWTAAHDQRSGRRSGWLRVCRDIRSNDERCLGVIAYGN